LGVRLGDACKTGREGNGMLVAEAVADEVAPNGGFDWFVLSPAVAAVCKVIMRNETSEPVN
jgi:hypothetical protein